MSHHDMNEIRDTFRQIAKAFNLTWPKCAAAPGVQEGIAAS